MGFFDYIGGKIEQAKAGSLQAQMDAEHWDARKICDVLARTSKMTQMNGYGKALRSKADEMSTYELKNIFDYAYNKRNAKACNVLMSIMDQNGLAYKDDNGKIHKNY